MFSVWPNMILEVAARTASAFNPNVHITPIHGNIKDTQYDLAWFRGFDIVLNALDNLGMLSCLYASSGDFIWVPQMHGDT
jgi:tRNA A37 threonylcarbamoyladenosine dehydratase